MTTTTTHSSGRRPVATRFVERIARTLLTPHPGDHYARALRLPGLSGIPGLHDPHTATVTRVDRSTKDWTLLTLELPTSFQRPPAGGALQVGVVIDGVVHRRHYSPVDGEHGRPGEVTIGVRKHPEGLVSGHLWANAAEGDEILVGDSVAEMRLPAERPRDIVLVSAGSGMTPMLAIAATLAAEKHTTRSTDPGRVAWIHYADTKNDVPFAEVRETLQATGGIAGRVVETDHEGFLTREHIEGVAPWHHGATIFLCGPDPVADGLEAALGADRFTEVLRERFTAPRSAPVDGDGGTVSFTRSGGEAEMGGESILVGAEAAGLSPKHGCRMGICHTCTATKLSGTTRDLRTGETSSDPDCAIQICVSAPVGDVEIEL